MKGSTQLITIILYFFFINSACSQNSTLDSLEINLKNYQPNDTIKVNLLNKLAELTYKKELNKAQTYLDESILISEKIDFKKGIAQTKEIRGYIQKNKPDYNESFKYFNEALDIYIQIENKRGISDCYKNIGLLFYRMGKYQKSIKQLKEAIIVDKKNNYPKSIAYYLKIIGYGYTELGNYDEAINYFNKSLALNIKNNNKSQVSSCYNNIGITYFDQGNLPIALEYYNKALSISEEIKDSLAIPRIINNIGIIYKDQEKYDEANKLYEKSLEIQKRLGHKVQVSRVMNNIANIKFKKQETEKALELYNEAFILSKESKDQIQTSICLTSIGNAYLALEKNNLALQYYKKANNINLKSGRQLGLCDTYLGMATVYSKQKNYTEALDKAFKSQKIANELNLPGFQKDIHELLSEIYSKTGNFKKAFLYHKKFKTLNDSIYNKKNIQKLAQLESEYKYKAALNEANNRELKLTKTVKITSEDLEKTQRNYLLAVIGLLLIFMFFGAIIFYQKFKNIKSKNKNIIIEQKLLRSQMTPHFIFNSLSVLQAMILKDENKKSVFYLSKFSTLLRVILENSRSKYVSLSKELIAIENYLGLQNLENKNYNFSINISKNIETSLFKIPPMLIQPFIENIIEHAFSIKKGEKKIDINLTFVNKNLICTIIDNGIGINTNKEKSNHKKKSLATKITKERLKILSNDFNSKGFLTIENRKKYQEEGTIVTLGIPYKLIVE